MLAAFRDLNAFSAEYCVLLVPIGRIAQYLLVVGGANDDGLMRSSYFLDAVVGVWVEEAPMTTGRPTIYVVDLAWHFNL